MKTKIQVLHLKELLITRLDKIDVQEHFQISHNKRLGKGRFNLQVMLASSLNLYHVYV